MGIGLKRRQADVAIRYLPCYQSVIARTRISHYLDSKIRPWRCCALGASRNNPRLSRGRNRQTDRARSRTRTASLQWRHRKPASVGDKPSSEREKLAPERRKPRQSALNSARTPRRLKQRPSRQFEYTCSCYAGVLGDWRIFHRPHPEAPVAEGDGPRRACPERSEGLIQQAPRAARKAAKSRDSAAAEAPAPEPQRSEAFHSNSPASP
jgi:hypothetical protein